MTPLLAPTPTPLHKRLGIRLLMLLMLALIPITVVSVLALWQERAEERQRAHDRLLETADRVAERTNDLIGRAEDLLKVLARARAVAGDDMTACAQTLRSLAGLYPRYSNFSRVDATRHIVCSSGPLPEPVDVSGSVNIKQAFATDRFAVSPFKFGVLTGQPILVFSQPLKGGAPGEVAGTVNTGLNLSWLESYLSHLSLPADSRVLLTDGAGTLLAQYPRGGTAIGSSIAGRPLGQVLDQPGGPPSRFTDQSGQALLLAMTTVPRVPGNARVVVTQPEKTVLTPWRHKLVRHLLLLLSTLALPLVVIWLVLQQTVVRTTERLAQVATRAAEGDLSVRSTLPHEGGDLARLAKAFDHMASRLQSREEALQETNRRYRRLVSNLSDHFLYSHDTTGVFTFVSPSVSRVLGFPPEALQLHYARLLTDNPINTIAQAHTDACLRGSIPPPYEVEMFHHNGSRRTLELRESPVMDDSGQVMAVEGIAHDVTDRKAMEQHLKRTLNDLAQANRDLEQFAYTASHNLMEPLRMVNVALQRLARDHREILPPAANTEIATAFEGMARLRALVEALLSYSRVAVEGAPMRPVALAPLLERVRLGLGDALAESKALLTSDPLPTVRGDPAQLAQLLHHLVSNAIRYRHPQRQPEVHITAQEPTPGWVSLSVADNGRGINARDLNHVFEIFRRPDLHRPEASGAGIGLATARRIVERHGGRIHIESDGHNGTTVTFTLARHDDSLPDDTETT